MPASWNRGLPLNVFGVAPFGRQILVRRDAAASRPAPLRPVCFIAGGFNQRRGETGQGKRKDKQDVATAERCSFHSCHRLLQKVRSLGRRSGLSLLRFRVTEYQS